MVTDFPVPCHFWSDGCNDANWLMGARVREFCLVCAFVDLIIGVAKASSDDANQDLPWSRCWYRYIIL
jgi:hypothetical protein